MVHAHTHTHIHTHPHPHTHTRAHARMDIKTEGGFKPNILQTELAKGPMMKDDGAVVSTILAAMYAKMQSQEASSRDLAQKLALLENDKREAGEGSSYVPRVTRSFAARRKHVPRVTRSFAA